MSTVMERKLGELLVEDSVISSDQLEEAMDKQNGSGGSLGHILMEMGVADEWEIAAALGKRLNVPFITLSQYEIDREVLSSIPRDVVLKYSIVPVDRTGDTLTVALPDPNNLYILDDLRLLTKCQIIPVISFETDILEAIERYYSDEHDGSQLESMLSEMTAGDGEDIDLIQSSEDDDDMDLELQGNEAPVIKLVNAIISEAIRTRSSDIHFEPYEKIMRLRYRIDGVLQERPSPPKKFQNAIVSRIKIMSNMNIAERRMPQDGSFRMSHKGQAIDFRVNTIPVPNGEKVVIRILAQSNLMTNLADLGFTVDELQKFEAQIRKPWGMVLVTGPTGSGKSTTLYSALSTINSPTKNITTIEQPIEYQLFGINQVLARDDIGLTFAEGLRAFLRQDPDIIMVGEIRDLETVEVAVKAALTGHLVFSTLHTNDAPGSISRMVNMGVEPFLITASLNMVVAQRLARRICKSCLEPIETTPDVLLSVGIEDPNTLVQHGIGCDNCNGTGYRGRLALYEIMSMTDTLRTVVVKGGTAMDLKREAIREGMTTLRQAGTTKIIEGVTTVEEILEVTLETDA